MAKKNQEYSKLKLNELKLGLVIRTKSGLAKGKVVEMGYNFEMYSQNILPKCNIEINYQMCYQIKNQRTKNLLKMVITQITMYKHIKRRKVDDERNF